MSSPETEIISKIGIYFEELNDSSFNKSLLLDMTLCVNPMLQKSQVEIL